MKLLNKTQSGRSMVEMLGVLAIIGVLSVGGIAGYSKAMFKHKMSKTMDILSYAVSRVIVLDTLNLGNEIGGAQDAINYGIIPDCDVNYVDIEGEEGVSCPLPVGELKFNLVNDNSYSKITGQFFINFTQNPVTSCVEFFNSGIYKNVPDDWWKPISTNASGGFISVSNIDGNTKPVYSKEEWAISQGAKPILTGGDIANGCGICKDAEVCQIYWVFRNEL